MNALYTEEAFNAVKTLRDAILGGNEAESRYGDCTDNAASHALHLFSENAANYLSIVGDVTVAMLLINQNAFSDDHQQRNTEHLIRSWCRDTTDSLLDFELAQLEGIEVAA